MNKELEQYIDLMKQRKEETAKSDPEDADLIPIFDIWRDDNPIMVVTPPFDEERNMTEAVLKLAIVGCQADRLWYCLDSFVATQSKNPRTGMDWRYGEMAENADLNCVFESLTMGYVTREEFEYASRPYHFRDGEITWVDPSLLGIDDHEYVGGAIPDIIRSSYVMADEYKQEYEGTIKEGQEKFDLTEEESIAHSDCAVAKAILGLGGMIMMATVPGTTREKVIRNSMDQGKYRVEELGGKDEDQ